MDYCVNSALKYNMDGIKRLILYYDLMCQYWKNFHRQFEGNLFLVFPLDKEIKRAIGLFHVHGHIDPCFPRYAPNFIPGAGQVDGEILETLWAVLNNIHNSIRRMGEGHRRETLDDHMNDSNWKKLVGMGKFNSTQYYNRVVEAHFSGSVMQQVAHRAALYDGVTVGI